MESCCKLLILLWVTSLLCFCQYQSLSGHQSKDYKTLTRQVGACTSVSCPEPLPDAYMSFEAMEWYLMELNSTHASKVDVTSIGKSHEGRDIWQVFIKATHSKQGNAIWLEGGIHAREWISPAVSLHLIERLVTECSAGNLFDVYVVPMANPDGYVYSWTVDRLWRKNRRHFPNSDCEGVDLNRNWNYEFGTGSSNNVCSEIYMGPSPFSEPETLSLKTSMEKVNQNKNLLMVIAIHSYGQNLLYPWGGKTDIASNALELIRMGNIFADAAKKSSGTTYKVVNSAEAYGLIGGSTDDWSRAMLEVKYTYTLELRDKGYQGFEIGPENIASSAQEIWSGMKALFTVINPSNCTLT